MKVIRISRFLQILQRGVTNTLFGARSDAPNELGTVAEELLTSSDARSPSEAPADIEAPPARSPSSQSLRSIHDNSNKAGPSMRQGSLDGFRPGNAGGRNSEQRAVARFSAPYSLPRSGANSLVHDGPPAHRNASTYFQPHRMSRLVRRRINNFRKRAFFKNKL